MTKLLPEPRGLVCGAELIRFHRGSGVVWIDDWLTFSDLQAQKTPVWLGFLDILGFPWMSKWWRRRELNPRPLIRHYRLYMLSFRLLI